MAQIFSRRLFFDAESHDEQKFLKFGIFTFLGIKSEMYQILPEESSSAFARAVDGRSTFSTFVSGLGCLAV